MIKIIKGKEPDFWHNFKVENPRISYDQLNDSENGKQIRKELRKHLLQEQYKICCYCCRKIDLDNSLNEHIRPQALYPDETMDYSNIEGKMCFCGVIWICVSCIIASIRRSFLLK